MDTRHTFGLALVSAPWPLFNRPSIQLGALKAFVRQSHPTVAVAARHLYLEIAAELGYDCYREIAERTWPAESLYAALLYPERRDTIGAFFARQCRKSAPLRGFRFEDILGRLQAASVRFLDAFPWERFGLVGFSICLGQLTSSLYFMREIKRRRPEALIVAGGSSCAGDMGESLLGQFSEIDFLVQGEGEKPLAHLVSHLEQGRDPATLPPFDGLVRRGQAGADRETSQVEDLDQLPAPEFKDYFNQLSALPAGARFFPRLPMEISRGCWWRGTGKGRRASGCAFCNLNLQWSGYRAKSRARVLAELDALTAEHQALSVSFMDNLLPARELSSIFEEVRGLGKDLRLFGEIRAQTPQRALRAMGAAGTCEVQVGVEALSSLLLKRMNKGTTALDNLEIMKHCEAPGLPRLAANLILEFPSSGEAEVAETLRNLDFALPFQPLRGIPFWLGYGSPVHQRPSNYGIGRIGNHPWYSCLFPPEVLRGLKLMVQGYQGEVLRQRRLWQPVREKIAAWRRSYEGLHAGGDFLVSQPILSYQDGRDFMIIRERQKGAFQKTHRLKGISRQLYLFCETQKGLRAILEHFPGLGEERAIPFLRMMLEKKLMFTEGDRWLSLAVPSRPACP